MPLSPALRFLLQPRYRRRLAIAIAGLSATFLIGLILFFDSNFTQRTPDSRHFVDNILGTSCLLAFWSSFIFVLITLRSIARESTLDLCPTCGYDLQASPHLCPECGTPKPVSTPSPDPKIPLPIQPTSPPPR
jgi:hypothetical protein